MQLTPAPSIARRSLQSDNNTRSNRTVQPHFNVRSAFGGSSRCGCQHTMLVVWLLVAYMPDARVIYMHVCVYVCARACQRWHVALL